MRERLCCHVQYTVNRVEAGIVPVLLTRGQTGLTVTQAALLLLLLLRDADVWAGSAKSSIRQQQNAEEARTHIAQRNPLIHSHTSDQMS